MPEQQDSVEVQAGPGGVGVKAVSKDLNTMATLVTLAGTVALLVGGYFHISGAQQDREAMVAAIKEQTAAIKESTSAQRESNCLQGGKVDAETCRRITR